MDAGLQEQVAAQYKVVASLARSLAIVHEEIGKMIERGIAPELLEIRGERSAFIMETLGDILNEMDAVDEADRWMVPVFKEAHRRWPIEQDQHAGKQQDEARQ